MSITRGESSNKPVINDVNAMTVQLTRTARSLGQNRYRAEKPVFIRPDEGFE